MFIVGINNGIIKLITSFNQKLILGLSEVERTGPRFQRISHHNCEFYFVGFADRLRAGEQTAESRNGGT